MAVKFKKKDEPEKVVKTVNEKAVNELSSDEAVDRYVELQAEILKIQDKLKPLINEQSELAANFINIGEDYDAADKVTLDGYEHRVELSAKSNSTTVTADNETIVGVIGEETFMALAKFGVTDLKKALTQKQLDKITETNRVGKRKIKIII